MMCTEISLSHRSLRDETASFLDQLSALAAPVSPTYQTYQPHRSLASIMSSADCCARYVALARWHVTHTCHGSDDTRLHVIRKTCGEVYHSEADI